jgi:lysophospholipase L1-like esterase
MKRHSAIAAALAVFVLGTTARGGEAPRIQQDRWELHIQRFEAQDRLAPPAPGGVVFVGSSSIVRWDLSSAFPELEPAPINRGFGGSQMSDAARYVDRIVIPHRPRVIVLYEGDNDLTSPASPEQIAAEFDRFADAVHAALPGTRILVIAIKPSVQRWALIEKARAANALIRRRCDTELWLTFVDVETPMLGADGRPRPELYLEDGLHLSPEGYRIWNEALRPLLTGSR